MYILKRVEVYYKGLQDKNEERLNLNLNLNLNEKESKI